MNAVSERPVDRLGDVVIWHDIECGGYGADLPVWEELARSAGGTVLELGCGTGRVALHLAERGHRVVGVERDPALAGAAAERAAERGLPVEVHRQDVETMDIGDSFALVCAPMQVIQLLPGAAARGRALRAIAAHLVPTGRVALAIVEDRPAQPLESGADTVPDVRERDGWVFSSLPTAVVPSDAGLAIRRLRQVVAPDGRLAEGMDEVELAALSVAGLQAEADAAGMRPAGCLEIAATDAHVGSVVVLLERGGGG